MKKNMKLTEQIKRMKSLMTEERLYGNLVDNDKPEGLIIEQVGKLSGKIIDDIFTAAKGLDSSISLRYTKAAKLHNMSVKEYFKAFKDAPTDLSGFISHINKYEELVKDILIVSKSNTSIDELRHVLGWLSEKSTKTGLPHNPFIEFKPGKMVFEMIPTEGGLRLNAMEAYRKTNPQQFEKYLKKSERGYIHSIEPKFLKNSKVMEVNVGDLAKYSDELFESKKILIIKEPDAFFNLMDEKAIKMAQSGEFLTIGNPITGEIKFYLPQGQKPEDILNILLPEVKMKELGLMEARLKLLSPIHWAPRKYIARLKLKDQARWNDLTASSNALSGIKMQSIAIVNVGKFLALNLTVAGICSLVSHKMFGSEPPEICTFYGLFNAYKESLSVSLNLIGEAIVTLSCDSINAAHGTGKCKELQQKMKDKLVELENYNCNKIPEGASSEEIVQLLLKEETRLIEESFGEVGVEASLAKDFMVTIKKLGDDRFNVAAGKLKTLRDNGCTEQTIGGAIIHKGGSEIIIVATSEGDEEFTR
jgi:hypothetical protein